MPADVTNSTWVLFRADATDADADAAAAAAAAVAALLLEISAGSLKLPRDFCQPDAYPAGTSPGDDVTLYPTTPAPRNNVATTGQEGRKGQEKVCVSHPSRFPAKPHTQAHTHN